jgi:ubiquitin-conjugating enzyme E2 Z
MPFEATGNGMQGTFKYQDLEKRIIDLRKALDEETESWIQKGAIAVKNYETIASNLQHQFHQCSNHFSKNPNGITITLEMEKDNPFVWTMVYNIHINLLTTGLLWTTDE